MKKTIPILFIFIFVLFAGTNIFSGCSFFDVGTYDVNDGFDTEEYIPPDYDFTITADEKEITASISNIGENGDKAKFVALPLYEYLERESSKGLSRETNSIPLEIKDYECGTSAIIKFDRYIDDIDLVYYKYFVIDSADEILAGPMYCTDFSSVYAYPEPFKARSIKGVMCEDEYREEVKDLGCSYTEINYTLDHILVPNEIYNKETGKIEELIYDEGVDSEGGLTITRRGTSKTEQVESFVYNGKKYYFRRSSRDGGAGLASFDYNIKKYTDDEVKVTVILLMHNLNDQYIQPYFLTYPATANSPGLVQPNTSNEYGANYWAALMEFFAERYSRPNSPYGHIQTYVLGNEIDAAGMWNSIVEPGHPSLELEDYVEEYHREMRISNFAVKKYYKDNQILVSLTHHWSSAAEYSPKDVLDYMMIKTLNEGNFDYGFALHPYGMVMNVPDFWKEDRNNHGMTGALTTSCITWSNLEVMELYLRQQTKLFNGQIRSVYLTEGGVTSQIDSTLATSVKAKEQQAAGVAYLYYKSTQLSCIKAVIYYRLIDVAEEGAYFGLLTGNEIKKEAYKVYKYIDTQYYYEISQKFLKQIAWNDSKKDPHGVDFGNVDSYFDTMGLFESNFKWSEEWDESKIGVRNIDKEEFDGWE